MSITQKRMLDKLGLDVDEIINAEMENNGKKKPIDKALRECLHKVFI